MSRVVHHVTIQPGSWEFEAAEDNTLLQAGLAAGVRLPSSCRNGTCRTCLCRLLAGRIDYRIEWPGVSREEKQEGWILPCVASARSDVVLLSPHAALAGDAQQGSAAPGK